MGIPSLFKWISTKYPTIISEQGSHKECDCFYVDFNAVIHISCCPSDGPTPTSYEEMVSNIQRNIETIVKKANPQKILFISTDGVAPRSKLKQQRARRYSSAIEALKESKKLFKEKKDKNIEEAVKEQMEKFDKELVIVPEINEQNYTEKFKNVIKEPPTVHTEEKISDPIFNVNFRDGEEELLDVSSSSENDVFDKNAITPGTPFMDKLEDSINKMIEYKLSTDDSWKKLRVIYSGDKVMGEGEQKIMAYIRGLDESRKKLSHVIFSPDADLIFLGLSLHGRNVKVMREDLDFANLKRNNVCLICKKKGHSDDFCGILKLYQCLYVEIDTLRRCLDTEFKVRIKANFNLGRMINDLIFIASMAGNDFVPTLPCFDVRFEAVEILISLLSESYIRKERYITSNSGIDFMSLQNFFHVLSRRENQLYYQKRKSLMETRRKFRMGGDFEVLPLEIEDGKNKYYEEKLGVKCELDVRKICIDYIKSLVWIYNYYTKDTENWDWSYSYHFAPFAVDLCRIGNIHCAFPRNKPVSALEQIMMVTPPLSKDLVPPALRSIFNECKEFYPENIKIDMFDKLLPWQGVVILPDIEVKKIIQLVKEKKHKLSAEEFHRNVRGRDNMRISMENPLFKKIEELYSTRKSLFMKENHTDYKMYMNPYGTLPGTNAEYNNTNFINSSISVIIEGVRKDQWNNK